MCKFICKLIHQSSSSSGYLSTLWCVFLYHIYACCLFLLSNPRYLRQLVERHRKQLSLWSPCGTTWSYIWWTLPHPPGPIAEHIWTFFQIKNYKFLLDTAAKYHCYIRHLPVRVNHSPTALTYLCETVCCVTLWRFLWFLFSLFCNLYVLHVILKLCLYVYQPHNEERMNKWSTLKWNSVTSKRWIKQLLLVFLNGCT